MALAVTTSYAAQHDTLLVSRASGAAGAKGNSTSIGASVSGDGRFVAFASEASNLDPADADGIEDVFVRDLQAATTTLVSRATGPAGAKGTDASAGPTVSDDGRYVAFPSKATFDAADGDLDFDVYVRDQSAATTTLVSRATGPAGAKGDNLSAGAFISGDGSTVVFESNAANLDPDDLDSATDVFARAVQTDTTILVSRASGVAGAPSNGTATIPAASRDGRYVAFASDASNLDPDDADATSDVFMRDLELNTTTLVSRASGPTGPKGDGSSDSAAISSDGRFVAFASRSSNLDPADADPGEDVFVRDLLLNTTTLVSRATGAAGAPGNFGSDGPAISGDGRYATFSSQANNLDPGDADTNFNVFVRDLQLATTTLVSRATGPMGIADNGATGFPNAGGTSADGRYVGFVSAGTNVDPADGDANMDVYVRDVLGPPPPPPSPGPPAATIAIPPLPAPVTPFDRDLDGIADARDSCPDVPNADQRDADRDAIGDACDNSDASPGPTAAKTAVARIDGGRVLVRPPGSRRFKPLRGAELLAMGSVVDARQGGVILTSARSSSTARRTQSIRLSGAIFQIVQGSSPRSYTDIVLRIPVSAPKCPRAATRSTVAAARVSPTRARLSANGSGRFRIRARNSRSTAPGTIWTTVERCDGTQTLVGKGRVRVSDMRTRKTVTVTAGRSYLARARANTAR